MPFDHRIGYLGGDQEYRADGIIVCRNGKVYRMGIAVGIHHGDDRDTKPVRFSHCNRLAIHVGDEQSLWQAIEVAQTFQPPLQLGQLAKFERGFLLEKHIPAPLVSLPFQFDHVVDSRTNGAKVGQRPAEPSHRDVRHPTAYGLSFDVLLRLTLGPYEDNCATLSHGVADEIVRSLQRPNGLLKIDDVYPVALGKDVGTHLGIPSLAAMAKVNSRLQESLHADDGQGSSFVLNTRSPHPSANRFQILHRDLAEAGNLMAARHGAFERGACLMCRSLPFARV